MILGFGQNRAFDFQRWVETTSMEDCKWLLREYWKRILLLTLIGLGASVAYNRWSPEVYVSHAMVRFIPPQVSSDYVTSNVAMQVEQRIFAVSQLVKSRLTATKLIEAFNLYPQRRRFIPIADLVPTFQRDLDLRTIVDRGHDSKSIPSILIAYRYADSEKAQKVVQRIVELIYEENRRYRSDQSIGTTDFLQQEVKAVLEQMHTLEDQLAELPTPGGEDKEYRNIVKVGHLHDLERRLTDLKHQMNYVSLDRNLRQAVVAGLEDQLNARMNESQSRVAPVSWAADRLKGHVEGLQARLDELKQRYKANHVDVIATEKALNKAKLELARQEELDRTLEQDRAVETIRTQLARAQSEHAGYVATLESQSREANELAVEIARLRAQFKPDESREAERLNLMREYQVVKDHYAQLTKRQRESELASDMERRGHGETVELVEPPTFPLRAELPNKYMVFGIGALAGFILGYIFAIWSFVRKPHVRIAQHLEILGPYPVLVSLPGGKPTPAGAMRTSALLPFVLAAVLSGCAGGRSHLQGLVRQADEAVARGDMRTAVILYRKAIKEDPRFGEAHHKLAQAYLAAGQVFLSREQLLRAGELLPDRFDVQEKLAELTYQVYFADPGRPVTVLREAEDMAGKLIEKWPDKASGYRLKAQVLMERRRPAEARDLMERVLERMEDGPIRAQLAAAYFQAGQPEEAERHLRKSIAVNPKFAPGFDLLYLQLMDRGRTADARQVLVEKISRHGGLDAGLQLAAHDEATAGQDSAEERLACLATQFRSDPTAFARIGDFWLHRGDLDRAKYWYESGQTLHQKHRTLYAGRLAELLMAKRDPNAARALIARELESNPSDPLMRAYQAAFEMDGAGFQERKQAQARLESVLQHMPNSPFVRLHLGRAYLLNGDVVRASEHLQNCITLDPNYAPGWLALAEADLMMGNTVTAQERLGALLRRSPGYTPARLLQAQASLAQRRPAEAQKALEGLLAAEPGNTEAMLILARAKAGLGERLEAGRLLDKVVALVPGDVRPVLLQARLDLDAGNRKGALLRLKQAAPQHPDTPELASMLASVALMAGEDQVAFQHFKHLVDRNADNLQYRLGLASSLAMLGRKKEAEEQYKLVQQKAGSDSRPWLLYGALMSSSGNHQAAVQAYQEVLKRDRQNPFALNNLAFLTARSDGDLQKALSLAEEAKRGMPHSSEIHDTLAYVYVRLGMKRNAIAALEEIIQYQAAAEQAKTRNVIEKISRGDLAEVRAEMEQAARTMD
jgi:predicted Zn-dependent protease/uncharacterized protein involved in exopolysaccharide biosynthesis